MKLIIITLLLVLHFTQGLHQQQVTQSDVNIQPDSIQANESPIPVSITDDEGTDIKQLEESITLGLQDFNDEIEATPETQLLNSDNTAPSTDANSQQFSIVPTAIPVQPISPSSQPISSPETDFQFSDKTAPQNDNEAPIQNVEQAVEQKVEQNIQEGIETINEEQDGEETQIQSIPIVLPSMPQPTTSLPNPTKNLSEIGQECLNKCRNLNGISCKKWEGDSITCCQFTGCQWPFYCNPDKIIIVPGCDNKP